VAANTPARSAIANAIKSARRTGAVPNFTFTKHPSPAVVTVERSQPDLIMQQDIRQNMALKAHAGVTVRY